MEYLYKINEIGKRIFSSPIFYPAVVLFLIMLLFRQCGITSKIESDYERQHNNYIASQDTLRYVKNTLEQVIVEKSAYEVKVTELTEGQKNLLKRLELSGKKKTPNVVIQTVTQYEDSIINILSKVVKDPNGNEHIEFTYNPTLSGKNKIVIRGKSKYSILLTRDCEDSTRYLASICPEGTDLIINQNIDLVTSIYRDTKTNRLMTRVSTNYPNMTFSEVNSFDITDDPDTKKLLRSARKNFVAGAQFGYGILGSTTGVKTGFYVGIGIGYSPKFLQFGK